MFEFLSNHQLNIMMMLSSVCGTISLFVIIAKALPTRRRVILLALELGAMLLLTFDRAAYVYSGNLTNLGYIMVRVTNFAVFFLTNIEVLVFNLYLGDVVTNECEVEIMPKRLRLCTMLSLLGSLLVCFSQLTGLYYYFDEFNKYHRGPGFVLSYIFPIIPPFIQLTVITQYRKKMGKGIYVSLVLFIVVPMIASVVQIFSYGLSLTNISVVGMAVLVYIFAILDINDKLENANKRDIEYLRGERRSMIRLFDQMSSSFMDAIDSRDEYTKGHSLRVAKYSKMIAKKCGKCARECDEIYYTALLHDVGKISIPDKILYNDSDRTTQEQEIYKMSCNIGNAILSNIDEYPYLSDGAHYIHERYDGKGYPEGLKGDDIPERARIISVANFYDNLTSKKRDRDYYPQYIVREELLKESGVAFDPRFVETMIELIDMDVDYCLRAGVDDFSFDFMYSTKLLCDGYRTSVSKGTLIERGITKISFNWYRRTITSQSLLPPSVILFDSYDRTVHDDYKQKGIVGYCEYAEVWFNGHYNVGKVNNIEIDITELDSEITKYNNSYYEIIARRSKNYVKLELIGSGKRTSVDIELLDDAKYVYLGLTGEHCELSDISIEPIEQKISE